MLFLPTAAFSLTYLRTSIVRAVLAFRSTVHNASRKLKWWPAQDTEARQRVDLHFLLSCLFFVFIIMLYSQSHQDGSKANSCSFRISGRLGLKETSPLKEKGEEKGIHLIQNDWRGRNHSYLIIDAFHTISVILREERLSHPQP